MIRLLGAGLVMGGCLACAVRAAAGRKEQARAAEELCRSLALAERELTFRHTELPELLDRLAENGGRAARTLFSHASGLMRQGSGVAESWQDALRSSGLAGETQAVLEPLGRVLGGYDAKGQAEVVARVRGELEQRLPLLREELRRRRRIDLALGGAAGGALVLMLL